MSDTIIFNAAETSRLLDKFFHELAARVRGGDAARHAGGEGPWGIVGIHRRGDLLAERLQHRIRDEGGPALPSGVLDITLYRDDFTPARPQPTVRPSQIEFDIDGANVLLVDDVFFTGRTIRAALTQLADFGRPRRVVLGVFIDRKMRELPIHPDHVGVVVERPRNERVQLRLAELDGRDEVVAIREDGGR
ncbi:MAG: bifunctional pyr operon transcriptional regulator/uracil phosphoribosyltransferase PyrR [Planctomycetes bacterium]|nr:bifunctional pyr operon transcriptional regulator/uracil phosphoribosyltransferase PyrR [Planctomycetota bacterium]